MPLIKPSSSPLFLVDVVTTTLFAARPTTDVDADTKSSLPVPAIAGGVVAGVLLAVAVTLLWICWGKAIKKTKEKQQQEKEKHRKTMVNTIRNARISGPKQHSHKPLLKRPQDDKRVKFVGDVRAAATLPTNTVDPERAKHMLFDDPTTPLPRPAWTLEQRLRRTGSVIWPKPLKKLSQNSIQTQGNGEAGQGPSPQLQGSHDNDKAIPHKPSNVSVTSQFSEASGEPRLGRVPSNLIIAALGSKNSKNSLHAGDRQSTSSLWSYLFKAMPGERGSHHSTENTYQPPEDQAGYPVGTAL